MCVIIYREPGIIIPHDKLVSACYVNADGMGIITVDRGKMELRKYFDTRGNDPDILERALEEGKNLPMYVHLRYKTKGNTDKSNVHPFGVLKGKKHGMDLQFMHNGTLTDYGTDADCDSKDFVKKLLTPLCEKLLHAVGPQDLTQDETLKEILKKYAGRSSYFMMVDNLGNHQIVSHDGGHQHEGWWSSNVYSFNTRHREPTTTVYTKGTNYRSNYQDNWNRMYGVQTDEDTKPEKKTLLPISAFTSRDTGESSEVPFDTAKAEAKEVATTAAVNPTTSNRERFIEVAGITSLSDVCALSTEDIDELVCDYPAKATLLILDLLKELYDRDRDYDSYADAERIVA